MTRQRNHAAELLKILSMFMIVALHLVGRGGVVGSATGALGVYAHFIYSVCFSSVNCFGLLSGYLGVNSKRLNLGRILSLWLTVTFWSLGIYLLFCFSGKSSFTIMSLLSSITPIYSKKYWYFTMYFALSFFTPYINLLLQGLSKKKLWLLFATIVTLFTIMPALHTGEPFIMQKGYSLIWLTCLYILGAILRLSSIKPSKKLLVPLCLGMLILTTLAQNLGERLIFALTGNKVMENFYVSYISPSTLALAICLVLLFVNTEIKSRILIRIGSALSPLCFGVYLVHTHPLALTTYIDNRVVPLASTPLGLFVIFPLLCLSVFLVCALLELLRQKIFLLLRINKLCDKLNQSKLSSFINSDKEKEGSIEVTV